MSHEEPERFRAPQPCREPHPYKRLGVVPGAEGGESKEDERRRGHVSVLSAPSCGHDPGLGCVIARARPNESHGGPSVGARGRSSTALVASLRQTLFKGEYRLGECWLGERGAGEREKGERGARPLELCGRTTSACGLGWSGSGSASVLGQRREGEGVKPVWRFRCRFSANLRWCASWRGLSAPGGQVRVSGC